MLEVKNLRKVYKNKNGADTNALDGVTLAFPETGMVFLLGKSGSGKSTLLNVCGGLDTPSAGEVIVKGRSSKDFRQSDFDSYRNTFVGFIFQEYNILNEFSVEDNIALALELQGKKKDRSVINALLEEVDLKGFAKRKPNTLSGGQKQRIAIARALVKAPEIIMADEPTGALDSNTGKQVLDTLKKLSKSKLVIIVSHDRDFAEYYADRIIELKDGKVISDVSKSQQKQTALSENVNAVGDVLCVKRGNALTDADFDKIKAFLKQSDRDVIIAGGQKDVENFKKVSRINDDGSKEVFSDTTEAPGKQYTKEQSRFIRSTLPLRHAFKIGVSSLRHKPFRLAFTALLCTVAFTLFGLLSTLNFYNSHQTFIQTLQDAGNRVMQLEKEYKTHVTAYEDGSKVYEYEGYQYGKFTDSEATELLSSLGADGFGAVGVYSSFNLRQVSSRYWINTISAFAVLPEGSSLRNTVNGTYPVNNNEILISTYAACMLQNCKTYDSNGNTLELSAPADIIGKKININGNTYKVTGIFDSGEIPSAYDVLKDSTDAYDTLLREYESYIADGLHTIAFVSAERLKETSRETGEYIDKIDNYTSIVTATKTDGEYIFPDWSNANYSAFSDLGNINILPVSSGITALRDDQTVVSSGVFSEIVVNAYYRLADMLGDTDIDHQLRQEYYQRAELGQKIMQRGEYKYDEESKKDEFIPYTDETLTSMLTQLIAAAKADNIDLCLGIKLFDQQNNASFGNTAEFNIAGVYLDNDRYGRSRVILSDAVFNKFWEEQRLTVKYYSETESVYADSPDAVYTKIYLPYTYSPESAESYWDIYSNGNQWNESDTRVRLTGSFVSNLRMIDETVKQMAKIFLYVGIVFAAFAILLFSNFISTSISQKKREIGILRAVGARSFDVFKIFFSESFIIAVICIALSTFLSVFICNLLNTALAAEIGASLFVFGTASFAVLVGTAILTVIAATVLPVYNAAKKKPVDSIRAI